MTMLWPIRRRNLCTGAHSEGLLFNDALSNGTSHYTAETTDPAIVTCDACGAETVIGCPDGREICSTCAADGVG